MEWISLLAAVEGAYVPSGSGAKLPKGTMVRITQDKGHAITVYVQGNLVRIGSEYREALGLCPVDQTNSNQAKVYTGCAQQEDVWAALRECYDPEISVNIVDLGLIYSCKLQDPINPGEGSTVIVDMTLTAPGCGMADIMQAEIKQKLLAVANVQTVKINLVFTPPWSKEMMTEAARLQLDLF